MDSGLFRSKLKKTAGEGVSILVLVDSGLLKRIHLITLFLMAVSILVLVDSGLLYLWNRLQYRHKQVSILVLVDSGLFTL